MANASCFFLTTAAAAAAMARSTTVTVGSHDTVPNAQTWSRLGWTSLNSTSPVVALNIHDPSRGVCRPALGKSSTCLGEETLLAASKWGLFFHGGTDSIVGRRVDTALSLETCDVEFDETVFVLNILTWQVGHLLVDILEPLFYATGGDKAHLFFHVANADEQRVLSDKLSLVDADTPFSLLRRFTDHRVRARAELADLGRACFADLRLELDASQTYYASAGTATPSLRERYRRFKAFLDVDAPKSSGGGGKNRVVLVRRKGSRELLNFETLKKAAAEEVAARSKSLEVVSLEDEPFSRQREILAAADVLVAQYGTAAHNVVFMRPGAVLLLLLQPGWCSFAWHYALQANLSGVGTVRVCAPGTPRAFRWTHRAWLQGPWITKDAAFEIDESLFRRALVAALDAEDGVAVFGLEEEDDDDDDEEEDDAGGPRVHASDARVESEGGLAKVMLVLEVVGAAPRNDQEVLLGLPREVLDSERVRLCVAAPVGADAACFKASAFNEFSTLDLRVAWQERVTLRCWLELDGTELAASETYWTGRVVAETPGLGLATITHSPRPISADGEPLVLDWRVFRPGETLEVAVASRRGGEATLVARLDVRLELQRNVAAFCRRVLGEVRCADLTEAVDALARRRLRAARLGLPIAQATPTRERPFVFLHNEKTAGSSLRRHIAASARRLGVAFYVPCYDADAVYHQDERCYAFDLENASLANGGDRAELAVVAGHFQWGVWGRADHPACFTMVRHPVDRAISLYYERVFQRDDDLGGRRLNDLQPDYFQWLLEEFKGSAFGKYRDEGMCDAACKMLLGLNLHKGRGPADLELLRRNRPDLFAAAAGGALFLNASLAADRLKQCVVGFQDDAPATRRALAAWFPWLTLADEDRLNSGFSDVEDRHALRHDLRARLEACNACDLALYDVALQLKRRQEAALVDS
ncbi:hypothetical protein CTAYLR_010395 [Chrysophaeum taylorii]|uniref:Glycosyltransferase 61 catalytic domain-containing protein n=1 Tax=Chrysophaeum taylorii TaxID=2483200 RepID=A0AAD7UNY4_9STRA|nr:hypothetical protein CTAYLR_010395 [Chrysophaeum taylorii]